MITKLALEGIDGSCKTTVVEELKRQLSDEGLKVLTCAPYRRANERLGQDVHDLWGNTVSAKLAIKALQTVFAETEAQARDEQVDVTIYDRHWMTAFTEIGEQPELVEVWGDTFVPACLLRTDPETASKRLANDEDASWAQLDEQQRYADIYKKLTHDYFPRMLGVYRSDSDVTPEAIARNIRWDMNITR